MRIQSQLVGIQKQWTHRVLVALITLLAFALHAPLAMADSFTKGTESYEAGKHAQAVDDFKAALAEGETAAARHNLALSYFKLEQPAEAAWQIERALVLEPHNREYRYKLDALRQQLGLFASSANWFKLAAQSLTLQQWVLLGSVSVWIALASFLLPKISQLSAGLGFKFLRYSSLALLLIAITGAVLNHPLQHAGVIIAAESLDLHAAPASAAPVSGSARPAERAQQIDQHGDFVQIKTEGGATGWIEQDAFRLLLSPAADT